MITDGKILIQIVILLNNFCLKIIRKNYFKCTNTIKFKDKKFS